MGEEVFIISSARTPIGSFGGMLSTISATRLGATAIKGALEKVGSTFGENVDEVIMGNVISANLGQAPARQAAIYSGLAPSVICTTVNKVCASGMKAVMLGAQSIQLGDSSVVVAGGMENMSQIPYYLPKARNGYGFGNGEVVDGLTRDGLTDVYDQIAMGVCGDKTAAKYGISREDQDQYTINSYQRTAYASENGYFENDIVGVEVTLKGVANILKEDEEYKKVKFEKIPQLKPAFSPDGSVTAANASTINDGAVAMVLAGKQSVEKNNIRPRARIVAYADAEQEPQWFTTTPVLATQKVLAKAGLSIQDIDYFEVNEAFSVVALAYIQLLELDREIVNVFGGAVSLGHPLGASGARIVATLLSVLEQKNGQYGLAAICNGGGGASAIIIERL